MPKLFAANPMPTRDEHLEAALRLHAHLMRCHLRNGLLTGPDSGVRFNLRAWRFLKSAVDFVPWKDDYVFIQSQGYWVLVNWMLYEATGEDRYRELALEATSATLKLQTNEGYWPYPLPERRHLIATVEGNWGAIALLASYAREPRSEFLDGAVRWYEFLVNRIEFQEHSTGEAINYYDKPRGKIPNNSVEAVWLFLRLWKAMGDGRYLSHVEKMLEFIAAVQLPTGELPYIVESPHERGRDHYLCFQYNAFQFLKLAWAEKLQPGARPKGILEKLGPFLTKGVLENGASATDCFRSQPEVDFYTAVLSAALHEAARMGLANAEELSQRCFARVLSHQREDGNFGFSSGDYGFLRDGRSYPRAEVMTLFHLLYPHLGSGFKDS